MPFFQEATFHDRQSMESAIPQSTVSLTFVDVVGATITTKDLSQDGTYLVLTPILVQSSLNNTLASFRITLDGNQIGDISTIELKIKEQDVGTTFTGTLTGVSTGQILQLQYATDKGTLTLEEFSFAVDGIPTSRVVE
tara:strand:- start:122 stop:535 length:414 start_codon:yes stop_codon:yes gene_type:complete